MKKRLTLSIQQPWAWLIVNGFKDIENRSWRTNVRGVVNIHAGKTFDRDGYDFVRQNWPGIPLPDRREFLMGGIVGQAEIIDCVSRSDSPWFFGEFGFVFGEASPCKFIPCRGRLGFFRVEV